MYVYLYTVDGFSIDFRLISIVCESYVNCLWVTYDCMQIICESHTIHIPWRGEERRGRRGEERRGGNGRGEKRRGGENRGRNKKTKQTITITGRHIWRTKVWQQSKTKHWKRTREMKTTMRETTRWAEHETEEGRTNTPIPHPYRNGQSESAYTKIQCTCSK